MSSSSYTPPKIPPTAAACSPSSGSSRGDEQQQQQSQQQQQQSQQSQQPSLELSVLESTNTEPPPPQQPLETSLPFPPPSPPIAPSASSGGPTITDAASSLASCSLEQRQQQQLADSQSTGTTTSQQQQQLPTAVMASQSSSFAALPKISRDEQQAQPLSRQSLELAASATMASASFDTAVTNSQQHSAGRTLQQPQQVVAPPPFPPQPLMAPSAPFPPPPAIAPSSSGPLTATASAASASSSLEQPQQQQTPLAESSQPQQQQPHGTPLPFSPQPPMAPSAGPMSAAVTSGSSLEQQHHQQHVTLSADSSQSTGTVTSQQQQQTAAVVASSSSSSAPTTMDPLPPPAAPLPDKSLAPPAASLPPPLAPPPPPPPRPQEPSHDGVASDETSLRGGRLWELAGRQVAWQQQLLSQQFAAGGSHSSSSGNSTTRARRTARTLLSETLLERMRSRANPDAPIAACVTPPRRRRHRAAGATAAVSTPTSASDAAAVGADPAAAVSPFVLPPHATALVKLDAQDEEFLLHSGSTLAHKRVKVAQLLLIGIIGILLGWLGNSVVGTSCHFCSIQVQVGQYDDLFSLHFGLYKYSTVDSSLNGYKYCYPYNSPRGAANAANNANNNNSNSGHAPHQAPIAARVANLVALAAGTYSLVILWWYLIVGQFRWTAWNLAVWSAVLAAAAQVACCLTFFWGSTLCRTHACIPGPASILALVTAAVWIALAYELHYNMPASRTANSSTTAASNRDALSPTPFLRNDAAAGGDVVVTELASGRAKSLSASDRTLSTTAAAVTPEEEEQEEHVMIAAHLEMADLAVASAEYMERFGVVSFHSSSSASPRNHATNNNSRGYQPPELA